MGEYCRPTSRSRAAGKCNQIACLLLQVMTGEGSSREEDASLLVEIARLAMAAAHDLDPQEEQR